jgi:uncharacterized membrane protein
MLVHFPVALWPAHEFLHIFASKLPPGSAAVVGFWLLLAGTAVGWTAAFTGLSDLLSELKTNPGKSLRGGFIHASINGSVLCGFSVIAAYEYSIYPAITHGIGFLAAETSLLLALVVGNYFGGTMIWPRQR